MIGTGISGLGAAYALSKGHEVELFERDDRAGGHSNTVEHMVAGRTLRLDTGFIVHNEDTYPNLVRLFRELGVRTQPSEMSFSVACDRHDLEYSGSRPPLTRLTLEIARFLRLGSRALDDPRCADWSLARYVAEEGYSPRFRDHFLVPLCAALWSTAPSRTLDFPLVYAVRFFANHGHPRLPAPPLEDGHRRQPELRARARGAAADQPSRPRFARSAASTDGIELRLAGDELRRFDGVVVATHADQALRLLEDPSEDERRLLGAFGTTENDTVLHTDERFLPRRIATRGSWNYQLRDCGCDAGRPTMTYYLNKLQRLDEDEHYCVTLNRTAEIDPARIIRRFSYRHPLVTHESMRAQPELPRLNGPRRTAFAGAWQGYCFHEDGLRSGLAAAAAFGATLVRSALYTGTVMHARKTPKKNVFRYRVCFYLLDLDELPELDRRVRLFGWNRRNVVSLHDRDHLDVRAFLAEHGIEADRILLLTNLRVLGYVFNPVSFFYCYRERRSRLHRRRGQQHLRRAAALPPLTRESGHGRATALLPPRQEAPRLAVLRPGAELPVVVLRARRAARRADRPQRGRRAAVLRHAHRDAGGR